MKNYIVYILYSEKTNKTYVGFTLNLNKRLKQHKTDPTRTTKRSDDYNLVWYSVFSDKKMAYSFERYLKTRSGRVFLRKKILGELGSSK